MTRQAADPFVDGNGQSRVLRGVAIQSYSNRLAELAGILGFDTVWIDIEHGPASFSEIESLCMAAVAGGCVPTVRIPDNQRHHILRTVESGAQIVVVPMIQNAADAEKIVQHGKFPPLGQRGFNLRSRGLEYGIEPPPSSFADGNQFTHLFAQIETQEAVGNVDAICRVPGLAGIVVGPGDLSASMDRPGAFTDPELIATVESLVRHARSLGKHAGIVAMPGLLLETALAAGCDLVICGSDLSELTNAWRNLLESVPLNSRQQ